MDPGLKGDFKYNDTSQISYRVKADSKENIPKIKQEQLKFIQETLKNHIPLDSRKNHKIEIRVLEEDSFSIKVDNESEFFISKKGNQDPVVIREKIKYGTIASSLKEFFRSIINLFYKPAFPVASLKERKFGEAVREDYRALRISLESGYQWLGEKKSKTKEVQELREASKLGEEERDKTYKHQIFQGDIERTIENSRQIEKALKNFNPRSKLDHLIEVFSDNIYRLQHPNSFTVPTGYLNSEGILQPIMTRFYRDKENVLHFEIYSDTSENAGKIPPTITRKFAYMFDDKQVIQDILREALNPLITAEIKSKTLYEAAKPSKTFALMQQEKLQEFAGEIKEEKEPSDSSEIKKAPSLSYEIFVRNIENKVPKESWTEVPVEKLVRQPGTPAARVSKWFDHLLGDKGFSKNEKLNLLFSLTEDFVKSQLQQISRRIPLQKQLSVYRDLLSHVVHVKTKIAVAINEGSPLDPSYGLPKTLRNQEKQCLQAIKKIESKIRKKAVEGSGKILKTIQEKELTISLKLPEKSGLGVEKKFTNESVNKSEFRNQIKKSAELLEEHLSPENVEKHQASQIISALKNLNPSFGVESLFLKGSLNASLVAECVDKILNEPMFDLLPKVRFSNGMMTLSYKQFKNIIVQLILEPTKLPEYKSNKEAFNGVLTLLRKCQDPNTSVSSLNMPAYESVRNLLNIKNLKFKNIEQNTDPQPFYKSLNQKMSDMTQKINKLKDLCAKTQDLQEKRALLEEIKIYSLKVLKMLPPPGLEGSAGEPSIWTDIPKSERTKFLAEIHKLEQSSWEAQMKLCKTEMNGKERFLFIKAQAIRQAIIRTEVRETQKNMEKIFKKIYEENSEAYKSFNLGSFIDPKTSEFKWHSRGSLDFRNINKLQNVLGKIKEQKLIPEDWDIPNPSYLHFEAYTLDTMLINQLLSQDLTATLSDNAEMERDLLAIHHFLIRDQNKGRIEGINIHKDEIQRNTHIMTGAVRTPFMTNISGNVGGFQVMGDVTNPIIAYPDEKEKSEEIKTLLSEMEKGEFYYRIASDPEFCLNHPDLIEGMSYFQSHPETLLLEDSLDIERKGFQINLVGKDKNTLAEVHTLGKKDRNFVPTEEEKYQEEGDLRIRKKKPFLPAVTTYKDDHNPKDLRVIEKFDKWIQYVSAKSEEEVLSLPPFVLQKLFQIRHLGANDQSFCSSYSNDTAINALNFLAEVNHQGYLQHDFVQQFIEETLSGSFIMQQALIDNPDLLMTSIERVGERIKEAKKNDNLEVFGFLCNVLEKMKSHTNFAKNQLEKQGWLSGLVKGSLPSSLRSEGEFSEILSNFDHHNPKSKNNWEKWGEGGNPNIDSNQFQNPLEYRINKFDACLNLLEKVTKGEGAHYYFKSNYRPIDKVINPQMRKQLYIHALQQLKIQNTSLSQNQFKEVFIGCRLLLDPRIKVGLSQQQEEILKWFREFVLPSFNEKSQEEKGKILTEVLNHELKAQRLPEIKDAKWQNPEGSDHYIIERRDQEDVVFNLFSMDVSGIGLKKRGAEKCYIPSDILNRTDMKQALKREKIFAERTTKTGGIQIYTWNEEGQTFTLTERKGSVSLTREIVEEPLKGIYLFSPISSPSVNDTATFLIEENGVWIREGGKNIGSIFTKGASLPTIDSVYLAEIKDSQITSLKAANGPFYISKSIKFDKASPLLFADPSQVITLLTKEGMPAEMRLKGTDLNFKREGETWVCYQENTKLGKLKLPDNDSSLIQNFGTEWDRYVIPFQDEKNTFKYVMLPYPQKINEGRLEIVQESLEACPKPEILLLSSEYGLKGSVAAELYLAHRFISASAGTKNITEARRLLHQAERHLRSIKDERPPADKTELENLHKLFKIIKENPAVSPRTASGPEALAANLRLSLLLRKFRDLSEHQGFKTLSLSHEENFNEMEAISKQYEAYTVFGSGESYKWDKKLLNLSDSEKLALDEINLRCLKTLPEGMPIKDYFGNTGRLISQLELEQPLSVDPQFILTLLRLAKPVDETINILEIKTPIPLDHLLANFWSYLNSIKENKITPDQLLVLFENSLIPPGRTEKEEDNLKNLDTQARQFLLAMAALQKETTGISPKEKSENALKNIKEGQESLKNQSPLLKSYSFLEKEFNNVINLSENLENTDTQELKLREIRTAVNNFSEQLEKLDKNLSDFKALQSIEEKLIQFQENIENNCKVLKGVAGLLGFLETMDEAISKLKEIKSSPLTGLRFPESMKPSEILEGIDVKKGFKIVKEIGLKKTIQLAKSSGQLMEKVPLFLMPLQALVEKGKGTSIVIEGKTIKMEEAPAISKLKEHPVAKKCFTKEEFETIEDRFSKMDPKSQG